MFKKGDIVVKVLGARIGKNATVTEDQRGEHVSIEYETGDPDYSPESFLRLVEPNLDYEMDEG